MNRAGKKKRRSWKYLPERGVGLLLSFSVPLFILLLFSLNPEFIHNLELKMFDQRFKWRGARDPGDQVIIVAIDEKSIERFGRWPWPRSVIAELIDRLAQAHAKVIAFDIVFSEPDSNTALRRIREVKETFQQLGLAEQGDAGTQVYQRLLQMEQETDNDTRLITAVQQAGNVVLGIVFYLTEKEIAHFSETQKQDQEQRLAGTEISVVRGSSEHAFDLLLTAQGVLPNIPGLSRTAYAKGYLNQDPDVDGVIRRTPLIIKFRNSLYPSLDLQILRASLDGALIQLKAKEFGIESFQVGNLRIPTTETGKLFIDYAGPESTFPTYSFSDVLQGVISPEIFQDKIVLIGPTALGISDIRITPFSTVFPGVEIHANVLENILNKRFIMRGNWLLLIDAVLIATLGIVLGSVILRLSPLSGAFITLICLGGYVSLNSFLLVQEGIWLHLVYPTMSIVLTYVSITVYKYFTEEKEKRFIKGAFSQYLAPSVINQLLADPRKLQLGGERRVCTAFFSDLAGFSTISEQLTPEDLVTLLNIYLSEMTDILLKYEGTVDKYEGDAIVAFFGAPLDSADHARRACLASLDMQQRLAAMRQEWEKEGKPLLRMRIGLNTGAMIIGNMGSHMRMNYTMMGDAVNLAARLEGANKGYRTAIMLSDATYEAAKESIEVRELDKIRVVGKEEPTVVYELLARKGELLPQKAQVVEWYTMGLEAYKTRQWDEAIGYFRKALQLDPDDGPSQIYCKRCKEYKNSPPPADWDGVYTLSVK